MGIIYSKLRKIQRTFNVGQNAIESKSETSNLKSTNSWFRRLKKRIMSSVRWFNNRSSVRVHEDTDLLSSESPNSTIVNQRLTNEIRNQFYNNSTTIPSNGKNHKLIISDELLKFIGTHRTLNELTQWRLLLVKLTGKINESNQYSVVNDNRTTNIYNNQLVPYVGRRTLPSVLCTMNIRSLQRLSDEIKYPFYNNSTTIPSN
ncbi:uncharacterized protein LOC112689453, partial [Sipha flava]|uniref:Uncharacterized protein LOC112689453 n=1 Tax=Sipha flava TaxID=143950 RepID=A0A8B8G892_9HEMI